MTEKQRIRKLLEAYTAGSVSRAEFDELHARLLEATDDAELAAWMEKLLEEMEEDEATPINSRKIFLQITGHPEFRTGSYRLPERKRSYYYWLGGAAAMICIGFALFLYQQYDGPAAGSPSDRQVRNTATEANEDIEHERAVLLLADGTEIDLEKAADGLLTNQSGAQVTLEGNELSYTAKEQVAGNEARNSIRIPKGKQYQIILPDGSKVWLNAASSLTYPVSFSENERSVEVQGEAYFEIVPDKEAPFIVHSATQKVEVLGTAFNISAYPDDGFVKTTLVNGSVRVTRESAGAATSEPVILRPGQQAVIDQKNSPIRISNAETEEVISWKQGLFVFNDEPVEQVMRKVARWYNVEVEYRDGVEDRLIGGSIPRFDDIHKLMKALQTTGLLHYRMEGGKIVIMK